MTPTELKLWRARRRWTMDQAAEQLGISPKTLANYERGHRYLSAGVVGPAPIPRVVALACMALEQSAGTQQYAPSARTERERPRRTA